MNLLNEFSRRLLQPGGFMAIKEIKTNTAAAIVS
jgi:hypothetical protein